MIEIKKLTDLSPEDLRRLNYGYTSQAKYSVRKEETHEETTITLELTLFDEPYVKRWETDDEEVARCQRVVRDGHSLGAFNGDELVGIAIAEEQMWNKSLWVWEFHVDRGYHHRGIGRRLMDGLVKVGREAGLRTMVCETQNTNTPAIDFYRAIGFEIEGINLSYYTNEDVEMGEVAIFMKRKL
jgi:ribosomal protein S18 acetylase RimI-like enzyme